jgi:polyadenylate-binding protein
MQTGTPYASASLYVGDLHIDVTEALLCDIFNAVGPVASIRVCRDAVTRRSLGYAYVNFHMMVDAERALDTMNYTMIKGRPIRIMWSHRDPSIRKSGKGNIFIKNLDKSIDNKMLYDTFCTFGNILSCKIAYDEEGRSKGYGFVHYETEEAAETAIDKVDGKMLKEKIVYVGKFKRKAERELEDGSTERKYTNIFVKNLEDEVTEAQLGELFGKFGTITEGALALMKDVEGKSKGFAFINFESMEAARQAVEEMNGFELNGKAMYVGRAQKKSERMAELKEKFDKIKQERINKYQGVNLYVKNLDETLEDAAFKEAFEVYGQITSCKIMRDDKGNAKGFGFVCYTTNEEASKAVTEMNGKILASKPIYVALAQRKEQRRAQLELQLAQRMSATRGNMNAPQMPGMYTPVQGGIFYPMQGSGGRGGQMYYQPQMGGQGVPRRFPQQGGKGGQQFPQGGPQGYMVQGPQQGNPRQPRQNQRRQQGGPGGPQQGGKGRGRGQGGQPGQQPGRGPQFQQTARNVPPAAPPAPAPAPAPQPTPIATAPGPVDFATQLAAVPDEQQKMMLGERLFPLIDKHPEVLDQAGKITGMLLDMDTPELLHLIESPDALRQKVVEAINVLAQHGMASAVVE